MRESGEEVKDIDYEIIYINCMLFVKFVCERINIYFIE